MTLPPLLWLLLLAAIAVLAWRMLARKDVVPAAEIPPEPILLLSVADVQAIETALGVSLPADYARFLQTERPEGIDDTSVRDYPDLIIDATREYRDSSQWPGHLVWIGDEADGCPRVIDCISGEVFQVEKGHLRKAFDRHASFSAFVAAMLRQRP
jgi:hypothetical protein